MKALFWDEDGFVLLYKRLENGKYKWPRTPEQARHLRVFRCATEERHTRRREH